MIKQKSTTKIDKKKLLPEIKHRLKRNTREESKLELVIRDKSIAKLPI